MIAIQVSIGGVSREKSVSEAREIAVDRIWPEAIYHNNGRV
jgi:uncharacterized protein YeaO (DUF488 family)